MMKCPKCNRLFATKRSLDQHIRDSKHSGPKATRTANKRASNRTSNGPLPSTSRGFDINPSRVPTPPGSSIVVTGEDRLASIDVNYNQSFFKNFNISPGMAPRITTLAKAYQRISWLKVKVTVTPQASTSTNGGYVCGFSMDPTDQALTAAELSSTQWSATRKWYESVSVQMPQKRQLLYTSAGDDLRLSVPATFWLISEGTPSSGITVIVTVNWTIRLTQPSLEHGNFSGFMLDQEVWPVANNYNLAIKNSNGTYEQDFSRYMPDYIKLKTTYSFFRVPSFNIEYSEGTGDTGTIQAHFLAYHTDKKMYWSQDGKTIGKDLWQSNVDLQCLLPKSTYLKYSGSSNSSGMHASRPRMCPSTSSQHSSPDSTSIEQRLTALEILLRRLTSSLEEGSMQLRNPSSPRPTSPALSTSSVMSPFQDPTKS